MRRGRGASAAVREPTSGRVMEVLELLGQRDITQLGLVTQKLVK